MDIDYPLLLYCVILYSGLLGNTVKHPHHVQIFLLEDLFSRWFLMNRLAVNLVPLRENRTKVLCIKKYLDMVWVL